jgi:hypothetical protein
MKWPLILLILSAPSWAARPKKGASQLLVCLGAEEKLYHKKKAAGALYDLNQKLISELVQAQGLDGARATIKAVCSKGNRGSLQLLEAIMLDPKGWFALSEKSSSLDRELAREITQSTPEIFLNFLSVLQAEAPTPDCMNKHIPAIAQLNDEVRFLQEEVDLTKITNKKARLSKIFAGIQRIDEIFEVCAKEKSKNTDKGAGKPSAQ